MSELCKWLHEQLDQLSMITHPFNLEDLPQNGIYFFYEEGEVWGHGGDQPRIVRVGCHRGQGNLRTRICETYLLDERRLRFGAHNPKPADRSIFRNNLGRALLNRDGDDYLAVWEIDFTLTANRDRFRDARDIEKEKRLEEAISGLLRNRFSFRVITVDSPAERKELEKRLIGTLAGCEVCAPSESWLGRSSPKPKIRDGKLWQVQNLRADPLGARHKEAVLLAINPDNQPARERLLSLREGARGTEPPTEGEESTRQAPEKESVGPCDLSAQAAGIECWRCGVDNPADHHFCGHCAARLRESVKPEVAPVAGTQGPARTAPAHEPARSPSSPATRSDDPVGQGTLPGQATGNDSVRTSKGGEYGSLKKAIPAIKVGVFLLVCAAAFMGYIDTLLGVLICLATVGFCEIIKRLE